MVTVSFIALMIRGTAPTGVGAHSVRPVPSHTQHKVDMIGHDYIFFHKNIRIMIWNTLNCPFRNFPDFCEKAEFPMRAHTVRPYGRRQNSAAAQLVQMVMK